MSQDDAAIDDPDLPAPQCFEVGFVEQLKTGYLAPYLTALDATDLGVVIVRKKNADAKREAWLLRPGSRHCRRGYVYGEPIAVVVTETS